MAKKKTKAAQESAGQVPRRRNEARKRIEQIDRQLVELAQERAVAYKALIDSSDGAGGDEAIRGDALLRSSQGPLPNTCVAAILRELASGCRQLVQPMRVAYLGPEYSYSHLATVERFGSSIDLVPVATIAAVFEEVHQGDARYGLVPVENSTDGRVADTLDMFARLPIKICGEVQLRIHHNLLGKSRQSEIREVYSKPQALSQCRDWLAKHLPWARPIEIASTAAAAQLAAEKPHIAAIASRQAGVHYGLDVIAAQIEDNRQNVTRFAVIGADEPPRSGNDKTALMFEIPHRPGALADAMVVFKRSRLNLTWIESFPLSGTPHEYLFFVELEGHRLDARVKRALTALEGRTVRLRVLGSYARTEPVD